MTPLTTSSQPGEEMIPAEKVDRWLEQWKDEWRRLRDALEECSYLATAGRPGAIPEIVKETLNGQERTD